jgi:hypothetical protein
MPTTILNAIVAIIAILVLLGGWVGIHLLARKRLGNRQLGCRGPVMDDEGNQVCCNTGEICEETCSTEAEPD